jgi:SAM-dependent methyltransferase
MPTTETIKNFYDGYLSHLTKCNERHQFLFNTFDTFSLKGKSVLDIGCGTGITTNHLARRSESVVGVDLSPVLIEYALQFNARPNIRYFVSDIIDWNWPTRFDIICMVDVLEHIPEDRLGALFYSIKNLSHERTEIYVNIPTGDVLRYLHKNRPALPQIVDVPHDDVLELFKTIGYLPAYYKLYWQQYVEYIFRSEGYMTTTFDSIFKKE